MYTIHVVLNGKQFETASSNFLLKRSQSELVCLLHENHLKNDGGITSNALVEINFIRLSRLRQLQLNVQNLSAGLHVHVHG